VIEHVAFVAMHTSPLVLPGSGDAGGMNVYLDRLARTLASRGVRVTTFTRRTDPDDPTVAEVCHGYRVVHIEAGPVEPLGIGALRPYAAPFAAGSLAWIEDHDEHPDVVHSHYWLSGRAGVRIKDALGVPLANSFHTLGKVKDAARGDGEAREPADRLLTEEEVIGRSNCVIASTPYEFEDLLEHYGASPERLCVSPPGVDHGVFAPGNRAEAKARLGIADNPVIVYAGRIQPHKGTNLAVEALSHLTGPGRSGEAVLHIIGGASGESGRAEVERCEATIAERGLGGRVRWFNPVPHETLADHYRAADVVVMPSRSESFGLVAAEAQACGTPVVAANRGGLPYIVRPSDSGLLVDKLDPMAFAAAMRAIIDHPSFAERLSEGAVEFSERFSWDATASRLLELYDGIREAAA